MTTAEQVQLATEKVAHWTVKQEKATALLKKWQHQLAKVQAKDKPQATAAKLPPVVMVPTDDPKVVPITAKAKAKKLPTPPKPKK